MFFLYFLTLYLYLAFPTSFPLIVFVIVCFLQLSSCALYIFLLFYSFWLLPKVCFQYLYVNCYKWTLFKQMAVITNGSFFLGIWNVVITSIPEHHPCLPAQAAYINANSVKHHTDIPTDISCSMHVTEYSLVILKTYHAILYALAHLAKILILARLTVIVT